MGLDSFLDGLDNDLAWRKKEISELQMLCKSNVNEILLKSLLLMLYAHWEGFIKNSSKQYLAYVSGLRIDIGALTLNYKTISMKGIIAQCYETRDKPSLHNELDFVERFIEKDNAKFQLGSNLSKEKDKSIIDTRDNLSSEVFFNLCKVVGFSEKSCIRTKKRLLDEHFLNNRNAISHGSKLEGLDSDEFNLDHESVFKLKDLIFKIMSSYQDDLKEYAQSQLYLREKTDIKKSYDLKSDLSLKNELDTSS
ncbi:MAE_28990/MAE_18760 family HEPN-like nuclease [Undibacterium sp. RuTC16W]|uniref:MAE_28990/MAE_18760 family HEPN-like nuclease n=1 Tax=Undibacterium sp. RuTC16W TaxID=3413048 RepID=UPI003BF1E104